MTNLDRVTYIVMLMGIDKHQGIINIVAMETLECFLIKMNFLPNLTANSYAKAIENDHMGKILVVRIAIIHNFAST